MDFCINSAMQLYALRFMVVDWSRCSNFAVGARCFSWVCGTVLTEYSTRKLFFYSRSTILTATNKVLAKCHVFPAVPLFIGYELVGMGLHT